MATRSENAIRDIKEIATFIADEQGTPLNALRWLDRIDRFIDNLNPPFVPGTLRPEFGPGVRGAVFESFIVLFTITESTAIVIRVLHAARDMRRDMN